MVRVTCSQGISQFYLHTPRSSANDINHACRCLPSRSWYAFTDPERMDIVTFIIMSTFRIALKCELVLHIPCIECRRCWLWCYQPERVDQWDISQVLEVVLVDMRTLRVCCCFHEMRPHSCTLHSRFRSTASFSREPVIVQSHYDTFTCHIMMCGDLMST